MIQDYSRLKFFLAILIVAGLAVPAAAQDTGVPDTIRVDSATAFVSGIGIVPIEFYNDQALSILEVTLEHNVADVRIDSFSFKGSRIEDASYQKEALVSNDSSRITILSTDFGGPPILAGSGMLGTLYLSYPQSIQPQLIPIDTTTWFVGPIKHTTSLKRYEGGTLYVPEVITGFLHILESPQTYDSVWVDEIIAVPGASVAVDVFGYNERPLAKLAAALFYATDDLALDSVSFVGTRCESATKKTVQPQPSSFKVYSEVEFATGSPLPPGSGPLMTLHFTIDPEALEGFIEIDSTTVGIISNTRYWLTAADGGLSLVPLFNSGGIDVQISTDVEDITDPEVLPSDYELAQNYPNPFNPTTNIEFSLPEASVVDLEIFNILGRKVRRLLNRELPAGTHRVEFDGRDEYGNTLATGVYFYRLSTDTFQQSKKMMLLK